jgi:hypothetical protein
VMTKKPTNWRPLVRHKCSQNALSYALVDESLPLVLDVIVAVDTLMAISS